jgi:hypothetical protein
MATHDWASIIASCSTMSTDVRPPDESELNDLLAEAEFGSLAPARANRLFNSINSPDFDRFQARILETSARVRSRCFGDRVSVMAPVEVSNACTSDCQFCGWRSSNPDIHRLKIGGDLVLAQVDYLLAKGIDYIELVGGDDFNFIRHEVPKLVPEIRQLMVDRGAPQGQICICSMALTQDQYEAWADLGVDSIFVWQETYNPETYRQHILGGPKSHGIADNWSVLDQHGGYQFRLESQERALTAGLDVGIGFMMGLDSNINAELLCLLAHAEHLLAAGASPLIIGMPTWNNITTPRTDLRPSGTIDVEVLFPFLAAVIFLSLPKGPVWVFPNCRVSMDTQMLATETSGCFSSTEVKLGPGGYLPGLLHQRHQQGLSTLHIEQHIRDSLGLDGDDIISLARKLDDGEQFQHHYHAHEEYLESMASRGLRQVPFEELSGCIAPVAQPSGTAAISA